MSVREKSSPVNSSGASAILRERSETIAVVERGRVAAFAELRERGFCHPRHGMINRHDCDLSLFEPKVQVGAAAQFLVGTIAHSR
jgi:hypothetical protein